MKIKINQRVVSLDCLRSHRVLFTVFICIFISIILTINLPLRAAESNFSKSFTSYQQVTAGSLVSLKSGSQDEVVLANSLEPDYLVGVAVNSKNSLLAVNPTANKVQVAVSGEASAMVSDIAGQIKSGDLIAWSPVDGVGARAKDGDRILGIAKEDFNTTNNASKQTVTNINGESKSISIGKILVLIAIGSATKNAGDISAIDKWATRIFGKPVSITRLILCGIIAIIALASLVSMIYSSIRDSIAAVGRNPLARPVIFESLAQVMSMVALVSVIAVASMYFVARV